MSEIRMDAAPGALPPLLFEPSTRRIPPGLESMDIDQMRKKGAALARRGSQPITSDVARHGAAEGDGG